MSARKSKSDGSRYHHSVSSRQPNINNPEFQSNRSSKSADPELVNTAPVILDREDKDNDGDFVGPLPPAGLLLTSSAKSPALSGKVLVDGRRELSTLLNAAGREDDPSQVKKFDVFGGVNAAPKPLRKTIGDRRPTAMDEKRAEIREKLADKDRREERIIAEFRNIWRKRSRE